MFTAKLLQGGLFKRIFDVIKDLIEDTNFQCSPDGLFLQAMDSSHVALIALTLRSEGFEYYQCDGNVNIGLKLSNFLKMLSCAGKDDRATLQLNDNSDSVRLSFESEDGERKSNFNLRLMDISSDQVEVPEMAFAAQIDMPSAEFQRICKDLSSIGDTVSIGVGPRKMTLAAEGDVGNAQISIKQKNTGMQLENQTIISAAENVCESFALRYLNSFARATPLSTCVHLKMSPGQPIVVEYDIADIGSLKFYLAPKI